MIRPHGLEPTLPFYMYLDKECRNTIDPSLTRHQELEPIHKISVLCHSILYQGQDNVLKIFHECPNGIKPIHTSGLSH